MSKESHGLAIVTGAAKRLGRAFALCLARLGYDILIHYNTSEEEARETEKNVRLQGVAAWLIRSDLSSLDGLDKFSAELDSLLSSGSPPLRVLVNSAAIMPRGNVSSVSPEIWDKAINLNLRAPFFISQFVAARINGIGNIIHISDTGGQKLWANYPVYVMSKSALEVMTRLQAKTYAPGIRVNAIAPGLVLKGDDLSPDSWEKLIARLPMQRSTTVADLDAALEFILKNRSITGQIIVVDGGYSLL